MATRTLTIACSCNTTRHTFDVSITSLPLPAHLCSCDISRRISGSLLTSYFNISHSTSSSPHPSRPDTSNLTPYDSSSILRRWFCSTCGTHMYLEYHADGHFEAATGTLQMEGEEGSDAIVDFKSCMWIEDTKDGGGSQFVTHVNELKLERWAQEADKSMQDVPVDWRSPSSSLPGRATTEAGYAHCHCKGVEFWITPPTAASRNARSLYADLLIPYHLDKADNPRNVAWWLPGDGTRYLAGTCACHACRRASGFDITFWAFIPTTNIFLDAELTRMFPADGQFWGTMRTYQSSPGVTRTFCAQCGANIFWNGNEETFGRRDLIDVAVGLLDAPSGARAEEMLAWWPERVSFAEFSLHRGLIKGLEKGLEEWAGRNRGSGFVAEYAEGLVDES